MAEQIFISFQKSDLQDLIIDSVNACLRRYNKACNTSVNRFLAPEEAAAIVNVPVTKLYELVANGDIPAYRKGTQVIFSESDLSNWLKTNKKGISPKNREVVHG